MKNMKLLSLVITLLITAAAVLGLATLAPARAASEPTGFKDAVLSIYPEYDDPMRLGYPTVLVMLDGEIVGTEAPVTIRFLVPENAVMYSAGSGPREQYVGGPPNRIASEISGWDEISYDLKTNIFVVEYYVPIPSTPDKSFSTVFIPLYPVNGLTVFAQEPKQSSNYQIVPQSQPPSQQKFTDTQGFGTWRYTYHTLESGQELAFSIAYTSGASSIGPVIAIVVIVGILIAGFFVYRALRKPSYSSRATRRREVARVRTDPSKRARFCSNCGVRLGNADNFCPECGAKVRGK
jgi:hypothetical protein